jgi:hypothetical protein
LLELIDGPRTILCLAIQITISDSTLVHAGTNQPQHGDKLGKKKDAMAPVDCLLQQFFQDLQLAGGSLSFLPEETKVAAHLAQAQ